MPIPGTTTEEKLSRVAKVAKVEVLQAALSDEPDEAVRVAIEARIAKLTEKAAEKASSEAESQLSTEPATPEPSAQPTAPVAPVAPAALAVSETPSGRRLRLVHALSYSYPGKTSFNIRMGKLTPYLPDDEYNYLKATKLFEPEEA